MINKEISDILHQASLKITADGRTLNIKHKFRWGDSATWGVFFFLCGGIFLMVISFIKSSDADSQIAGILCGLLLTVIAILTLFRQGVDGVIIKDGLITYRYNLQMKTVPLTASMKIKMRTEVVNVRRNGTLGSCYFVTTYYLQDLRREFPVLFFQMDNKAAEDARRLGAELMRTMNVKFQQQFIES